MPSSFRILPLLIFVAILAFSVRLAEIITGVTHLSGSAYAEEKTETPDESKLTSPSEEEKKTDVDAAATPEKKEGEEKTAEAEKPHDEKADTESKDAKVTDQSASAPAWRDAGDSDLDVTGVKMQLLEDVAKRSTRLDEQEKVLKTREALLKATEQEIDRKYQELTKLRTEIEGLLGKQSEEEEKRITSLVKIYEGMKPKDAARIFDTLDLDILVSVVSKMSERKIAPILGLMTPERAKTLTIMLAEQKQLPSLGPSAEE